MSATPGPSPDQPPSPPPESGCRGGVPLRVSTLELFFDLVFAFTLTQLTELLARDLSLAGVAQVLLIFGVLWWMYGGYAWLTNTRTPDRTPERLLLLVGMAGFLVVGLAIPHGFGPEDADSGAVLGLGYLIVVLVHTSLYYRLNRNIMRIAPFNITSALLVILAGAGGRRSRLRAVGRRAGHPGALTADRPAPAAGSRSSRPTSWSATGR